MKPLVNAVERPPWRRRLPRTHHPTAAHSLNVIEGGDRAPDQEGMQRTQALAHDTAPGWCPKEARTLLLLLPSQERIATN